MNINTALEDRLSALEGFAAVGRRLSFTKAADELGISASALSHRIGRLEAKLGTRLFNRTTRKVSFTHAGLQYYERIQTILEALNEADELVHSEHNQQPMGLLRIALPNVFGQVCIAPLLPEFMQRYPGLMLDLSFSDLRTDLVGDSFDVGIRIGNMGKHHYASRKLAINERVLCASPAFIERWGPVESPQDLHRTPCLQMATLSHTNSWSLQPITANDSDEIIEAKINTVMRSDNGIALQQAALAGLGITMHGMFLVRHHLESGSLVRVLPQWRMPKNWIWAIYPTQRLLPRKVRVFIDFMAEKLSKQLGEP
jgi:DNA-binding transcriptional LysR family regulator